MKKKGCPYISGRSEWWVEYTYILLWVTAFTAGVQARTSFADMKVGGSCASGRGEIIIIIIIHDRKKNRKRYFLLCHFSSVCSSLAVFSHSHTHTIKKREEKKTHVCHVFLPPFFLGKHSATLQGWLTDRNTPKTKTKIHTRTRFCTHYTRKKTSNM